MDSETMWDKQKGLGYQGEGGILRQYINLLLCNKVPPPPNVVALNINISHSFWGMEIGEQFSKMVLAQGLSGDCIA